MDKLKKVMFRLIITLKTIPFFIYPVFRKLDRIGDLSTNLAENLIFYIEAKVLRHKKKKIQKFIDKAE